MQRISSASATMLMAPIPFLKSSVKGPDQSDAQLSRSSSINLDLRIALRLGFGDMLDTHL